MAYLIETIGTVTPFLADRLRAAGIATTDALLASAGAAAERRRLSEATGIPGEELLRWARRCDLFRVHGLSRPMAELLEAVGIGSAADLAGQEPGALRDRLEAANAARAVCAVPPPRSMVAGWIHQAAQLAPRLEVEARPQAPARDQR
ncbi:DUF4332 domain-containing protein [Methylobacterium sp. JK268]